MEAGDSDALLSRARRINPQVPHVLGWGKPEEIEMHLTDRDRKLLWTRAANRCSYRFGTEICARPLTSDCEATAVVLGQECHIVGEKPGAARFLEDFTDRESYSNAILLCGDHHKLIDDAQTRGHYPPQLLREMKAAHERDVRLEAPQTTIRDSTFSATAKDSDVAIGLDVSGPTSLSNVSARVTADNVREACGARFRGGMTAHLSVCRFCGSRVPAVTTGGATPYFRCPNCGQEQ